MIVNVQHQLFVRSYRAFVEVERQCVAKSNRESKQGTKFLGHTSLFSQMTQIIMVVEYRTVKDFNRLTGRDAPFSSFVKVFCSTVVSHALTTGDPIFWFVSGLWDRWGLLLFPDPKWSNRLLILF